MCVHLHTHTHTCTHTHLFLGATLFDEEINDPEVLQSLPVTDVLKFGILHTEVQHGRMGLQDLTHHLHVQWPRKEERERKGEREGEGSGDKEEQGRRREGGREGGGQRVRGR